jgi:phosphoglycolate phosphatase
VTDPLAGIRLVIFDKDGTLIDFHAMWSGWMDTLADDLELATGRPIRAPLFAMMGYDAATGRAHAGGGLVSTPMARLRDRTARVLAAAGVAPAAAEAALRTTWQAPDPVELAHPLVDLPRLLGGLRAAGRRCAIATSDDRAPTERTLQALGIAHLIDAVVCADDGVAAKPAPDTVTHLCRQLSVDPAETAVVGDSPADLAMGRSAGAGLVVGVRTGVGTERDLAAADLVLDSVAGLIPSDP